MAIFLFPELFDDGDDGDRFADRGVNDGMGPYGRPAKSNAPPEPPLYKGHVWTPGEPGDVEFDQATGRFSDGYEPRGAGLLRRSDKPDF